MSEEQKILGRIREALREPAPKPGAHGHRPAGDSIDSQPPRLVSDWLPIVGPSFEERVELFASNSLDLKTDFRLLNNFDEMTAALRQIAESEGWKKVGAHAGELTTPATDALGLPVCSTTAAYDVKELESCDAGISECDALIAQTGSILVSTRSAGGRALSVLPPHHIVLGRREQLVPDLSEAILRLKQKYAPEYPSFFSFITGPSRTGDIERILVLGAHGPRRLTVLCY